MRCVSEQTTLEAKIQHRLRRWGRGAVFSNSDFFSLAPDGSIAWNLFRLKEKGVIKPLLRGLYLYPRYSKLLQEDMAADLHRAAEALARKHRWHIQASGSAALQYWGLSTQIPTRVLYYSDGPHRLYRIEGRTLEFRHIPAKEAHIGSPDCERLVQAVKELGELSLTPAYCSRLQVLLTAQRRRELSRALPLLSGQTRHILRTLLTREGS